MSLVQTQCPHCKAPMYAFQPGCFSCRQGVQWPPPQTPEQQAMHQAATAWFNQALGQYQAQQQQQQAAQQQAAQQQAAQQQAQQQQGQQQPRQAVRDETPPAAAPQRTAPPPDPSLQGLVETTSFGSVAYDPQAAEDVEGLLPSSYAEFVPRELPIPRETEMVPTTVEQSGPGLGLTGLLPEDGFEATHAAPVAQVPMERVAEFDPGRQDDITRTAPEDPHVVDGGFIEVTSYDPAASLAAQPARTRKTRAAEGSLLCPDCGTRSEKSLCPSCGARTRAFAG